MQLWDPASWADSDGYWLLWSVVGVVLIGVLVKLAGVRWDDWLDERLGRGSVRDDWPDEPDAAASDWCDGAPTHATRRRRG